MRSLYAFLDRPVTGLADDDVFILCAARTWVLAAHDQRGARDARGNRCVRAMLRPGFALRPDLAPAEVEEATLAFACAMALLDRHGWGTMRFLPVCGPMVSDDEARVLTLFASARVHDPQLVRIAASLVSDEMAPQLAGAAIRVACAMHGAG